jgi:hypothetical protein
MRVERLADHLVRDARRVPRVPVGILAVAEELAGVGVQGIGTERGVAGRDPGLVAGEDAAVTFQCLPERAGPGLDVGHPLARAVRAQPVAQAAQRGHPQGPVGSRRVAADERQPAAERGEGGDDAGHRVDQVTPGGQHRLRRAGPVAAVGAERLHPGRQGHRLRHPAGAEPWIAAAGTVRATADGVRLDGQCERVEYPEASSRLAVPGEPLSGGRGHRTEAERTARGCLHQGHADPAPDGPLVEVQLRLPLTAQAFGQAGVTGPVGLEDRADRGPHAGRLGQQPRVAAVPQVGAERVELGAEVVVGEHEVQRGLLAAGRMRIRDPQSGRGQGHGGPGTVDPAQHVQPDRRRGGRDSEVAVQAGGVPVTRRADRHRGVRVDHVSHLAQRVDRPQHRVRRVVVRQRREHVAERAAVQDRQQPAGEGPREHRDAVLADQVDALAVDHGGPEMAAQPRLVRPGPQRCRLGRCGRPGAVDDRHVSRSASTLPSAQVRQKQLRVTSDTAPAGLPWAPSRPASSSNAIASSPARVWSGEVFTGDPPSRSGVSGSGSV